MSQPPERLERKISFSWEKKPGVSKVTSNHGKQSLILKEDEFLGKLPPPPCTTEPTTPRTPVLDFQIPLPPCAFQPPYYRTSSKRGLWVQDDDPFLAAYKECTKNQKSGKGNKKLTKEGIELRLRRSLAFFLCKRSCTVRDNNLVRISHLDKD